MLADTFQEQKDWMNPSVPFVLVPYQYSLLYFSITSFFFSLKKLKVNISGLWT